MEYTATNNPNRSEVTFNFKRFLGSLLGNWYWIVLSVLIFFIAAYLYIQATKPLYLMKSSLQVAEEVTSNNVLEKLNMTQEKPLNLYNEINLLRSEDIISSVVDSLGLNVSYFTTVKLREKELYGDCPIKVEFQKPGYQGNGQHLAIQYISNGNFKVTENGKVFSMPADTWVSRPYGTFRIGFAEVSGGENYLSNTINAVISNRNRTTQGVLSNFQVVSADGRTSVIDLLYKDNIPARGVDFLNALISFYYRAKLANINQSVQSTRDFINQRKNEMMKNLRAVDSSVESIKLTTNVVDPNQQATTIVTEKKVTQKALDELYTKRKSLINLRNLLLNSDYEIIVPLGLEDDILKGLVNQYNNLVQKLGTQEQVQELGRSNPFLIQTQTELEALKRRILDVLSRISDEVNNNIEVTTRIDSKSDETAKNVAGVDRQITEIKRGYDVLQNMYLYLYQKGIENEITAYNESNKSKVLIPPYAGGAPISPIKNNIYSLALFLGFMLPVFVLFLLELLNKRILHENDITSLTDIPLLGIVSYTKPEDMRYGSVAVNSSASTSNKIVSEQFRTMRTNLELPPFINNNKVITVTSSDSEDGKTFTAINLGLILALSTKRAVVIEFDLRKPKLFEVLNIDNGPGVCDYLNGNAELKNIIKRSGLHNNMYVISCGNIPPNPGDLLTYPSTLQLINDLQEMFDVIIIDTPPVSIVTDTLIISKYSNINLFVVRQAKTFKSELADFNALYAENKIHNPAIIFNGVKFLKKYGYFGDPFKTYESHLLKR
jgi:tyrosine-protein kinase Etk/Wzc